MDELIEIVALAQDRDVPSLSFEREQRTVLCAEGENQTRRPEQRRVPVHGKLPLVEFDVAGEERSAGEAEGVLERVGLLPVRDTPASALSHGDQRLLEVGVALAARPVLLFLDEPTAGMNPVERVRVLENIRRLAREGRTTFVIVEHDMDVVFSLSERIIVLHRGVVIGDGPPGEIRDNPRVREVYLGDDVADLFRYTAEVGEP